MLIYIAIISDTPTQHPSLAKPIDVLAKYINSSEEDVDIEVQEPYFLLCGLNIVDLEDLLEDIKVYREMEMYANGEFWSVRIKIGNVY